MSGEVGLREDHDLSLFRTDQSRPFIPSPDPVELLAPTNLDANANDEAQHQQQQQQHRQQLYDHDRRFPHHDRRPSSPAGASSNVSEYGSSSSSDATGATSTELTAGGPRGRRYEDDDVMNRRSPPPQPSRSGSGSGSSPGRQRRYYRDDGDDHGYRDDRQSHDHDDERAATTYSSSVGDATRSVHEMHDALLYLMSNPEEFQRSSSSSSSFAVNPAVVAEWNERVRRHRDDSSSSSTPPPTTPLPFVVFAEDAEVVLPQAHTASQLFGVERSAGVELEAAAGLPALSQLFSRWLALMPGGDHRNLVDPPGLTVMRIAGGRYRVTAAHRVVWSWLNDFGDDEHEGDGRRRVDVVGFDDLVTMTIVDVFETDRDGRLLSYCPTFDNRAVARTTAAAERLAKEAARLRLRARVDDAARRVDRAAAFLGRVGRRAAARGYERLKQEMDARRATTRTTTSATATDATTTMRDAARGGRSEHYVSDDETTTTTTRDER